MAKKKVTYAFGADLSELEKGWKRIDYKLGKLSSSLQKTGRAMTTAFTVPLAAIGAAATKSALDVDRAMSSIARGTGATGAALKGLQTEWKSLAGSVSQNFETSAKVLADYNTRLGLTGKALKDLSKQALDAGRMLGEDVNAVVKESAKAMQDWGVPAEEMTGYMDKIFLASQSTGVGMAELSGNMYKYGSALRQMGFSTNDTIATLAQFDKQGVNTELVMGSLRIALGKLAKAGVTDAAEGFRILTEQIKNAKSPTEATRKAIELFGSRAGPDMAAAIREGRFEIGELSAALLESQGAIERNSAATKTFGDRWLETKNQVGIAIAPIGKQLLNLADSVMPSVKAQAEKLGTAIENMSEDSRKAIIALAAAFAVGGPLLIAISATIKAFSTLSGTLLSLATGPAAPFIVLGVAIALIVGHFNDAEKAARDFNNEVSQIDTSKIKELQSITNAGIFGAEGLKGSIAIANEGLKKIYPPVTPKEGAPPVADVPVASPVAPPARRTGGGSIHSTGGSKGKSGPSAADQLVVSIRAIGAETAAAIQRIEDLKAQSQDAIDSASAGVEQFWSNMNWEHSQGLLGDENYFSMLNAEIEKLTVNSDAWKARFTELQSIALQLSGTQMDNLNEQLKNGKLSTEEWTAQVAALKDEYSDLPNVLKAIDIKMGETKGTISEVGDMTKLWANDLSQGLAQAIVNAEDLGDALRNIAKSIAGSLLQKLIGGWIGGLFADGAAFQDGRVIPFAKGGIVTKPTIFPMARGMGLMGEAGPEAVMPLTRTAGGELGVKAEGNGSGGTHITMNINAVDSQSFIQMLKNNKAVVESLVIENIYRNGSVRKAIQQGV